MKKCYRLVIDYEDDIDGLSEVEDKETDGIWLDTGENRNTWDGLINRSPWGLRTQRINETLYS